MAAAVCIHLHFFFKFHPTSQLHTTFMQLLMIIHDLLLKFVIFMQLLYNFLLSYNIYTTSYFHITFIRLLTLQIIYNFLLLYILLSYNIYATSYHHYIIGFLTFIQRLYNILVSYNFKNSKHLVKS